VTTHCPVLLNEVLELLSVREGGTYVDGTLGGGGHAEALLRRIGANGRLLAIDRDPVAIDRAQANFAVYGKACRLAYGNYADMAALAQANDICSVDGVLIDCGVSSDQLDMPERGFSFRADGPLDMRMDSMRGETAADLIARLPEADLAYLIWKRGEEPAARKIARRITEERLRAPICTTGRLAQVVADAVGGRHGRIHPATKTFQALRMTVNNELDGLRQGLLAALDVVRLGGRVAVITFHSLEDRLVKQLFAEHVGRWENLQGGGAAWKGATPAVARVTRKPVVPGDEEQLRNPRARSAKLRVVERI
jgi:16S rRNA (cytosine1402-N4)-methyltransferase